MSTPQFASDEEKGAKYSGSNGGSYAPEWDAGGQTTHKEPWRRRFVDSFKRDPNAHVTRATETGKTGFDHAAAAEATANSGLARKLKGRHMQMIAIGGSIGWSSYLCQVYILDFSC